MPAFVDVHSHMVPSGDDGVQSSAEGLALLRETARRGTVVQFATPHANRTFPWSDARRADTESAFEELRRSSAAFGLELELGAELSAEAWLLDADPRTFRLGTLEAALLEFPLPHTGARDLELLEACAEHLEAAGLRPILAHPERSAPVHRDPGLVAAHRERGRLLQINASSLLGQDGVRNREIGWQLVEQGLCDLVASDAHRATRPPYLDAVHALLERRVGVEQADALCGGAALAAIPGAPGRIAQQV